MNWFRKFMAGRYGSDELNMFLIMAGLIVNLIAVIFNNGIVSILAAVPLGLYFYRALSKNIPARRAENAKFLKWRSNFVYKVKNLKYEIAARKTHKYFKCPKCGQKLRVPKGKGAVNVKCPKCGERFERKT